MPNSNKPKIKCGKTDGFRYIALRPPLSVEERKRLAQVTLTPIGAIEDVDGTSATACSMLQYDIQNLEIAHLRHPEELVKVANQIAELLKPARRSIVLNSVTPLGWGNSSPFNPNPGS
jgi:hypothetical protein